jgi:hypothetical protein
MVVELTTKPNQPSQKIYPPQDESLAHKERSPEWYRDHLMGLMSGDKRRGLFRGDALKFMANEMRDDVKELLLIGKSRLVHRVWLEKFDGKKGENLGGFIWATGLLHHAGAMPATPVLIGAFLDPETRSEWEQVYDQRDDKVAYEGIKAKLEEWLVSRLVDQQPTFLGGEKEPKPGLLRFGPDQALHIFINGWTGNHLEFMEHMRAIVQGVAEFGKSPKWLKKITDILKDIVERRSMTFAQTDRDSLLARAENSLGQRDPRNHIFIGFGNMGSGGTTPDEINQLLWHDQPSVNLNSQVGVQDIVNQPVYALDELARHLVQLRDDQVRARAGNLPEVQNKGLGSVLEEDFLEAQNTVLRHVVHFWCHSMGGHVGLLNLDPQSMLQRLLDRAGNDYWKVHSWNSVTNGMDVELNKVELARVRRLYHEETLPRGTAFIDPDNVIGLIVRHAPVIMRPQLIHLANQLFGVSARLTKYLLGSLQASIPWAVHEDVNRNGSFQSILNTRLCDELPFFIKNDSHLKTMRDWVATGRLEIWNGTEPKPGDRILTAESVALQAKTLLVKSYIETHDHLIEPDELRLLTPLVVAPMRGTEFGSEIDPYDWLKDLMDPEVFKKLVKKFISRRFFSERRPRR